VVEYTARNRRFFAYLLVGRQNGRCNVSRRDAFCRRLRPVGQDIVLVWREGPAPERPEIPPEEIVGIGWLVAGRIDRKQPVVVVAVDDTLTSLETALCIQTDALADCWLRLRNCFVHAHSTRPRGPRIRKAHRVPSIASWIRPLKRAP